MDSCLAVPLHNGQLDQDFLDAIANRIAKALACDVALVTKVDFEGGRQQLLGMSGLAGKFADQRETPLSHSFCRHVVRLRSPLIVTDALHHPLVSSNGAVADLNVRAYVGVPPNSGNGETVAVACAISTEPRQWTKDDLARLLGLVELAIDDITMNQLRAAPSSNEHQASLEVASDTYLQRELFKLLTLPHARNDEQIQRILRHMVDLFGVEVLRLSQLFDHSISKTWVLVSKSAASKPSLDFPWMADVAFCPVGTDDRSLWNEKVTVFPRDLQSHRFETIDVADQLLGAVEVLSSASDEPINEEKMRLI